MKVDIDVPSGFTREIAVYVSGLDYGRSMTLKLLEDLTPAEIAHRVMPQIHSIGALALHLGECEFYWMLCVIVGRKMSEEDERFAHLFDTMENDSDRGFDANYLITKLSGIRETTFEILKNMDDADLDKFFSRPESDGGREHSLREILQRIIDHEANHRGQISMIRRVIRGEEAAS